MCSIGGTGKQAPMESYCNKQMHLNNLVPRFLSNLHKVDHQRSLSRIWYQPSRHTTLPNLEQQLHLYLQCRHLRSTRTDCYSIILHYQKVWPSNFVDYQCTAFHWRGHNLCHTLKNPNRRRTCLRSKEHPWSLLRKCRGSPSQAFFDSILLVLRIWWVNNLHAPNQGREVLDQDHNLDLLFEVNILIL